MKSNQMSSKILSWLLLVVSLFTLTTVSFSQTKPVKGTWVTLTYQDVRFKYMNPEHINCLSPEFWEKKLIEQAEMGIEYIIIMAIANERKSFYPSDFMEPAFPKGQKSPVEAIMETADRLNMKVFMSCGWAVNGDDNLQDPEIREIQQKIMVEVSEKLKHHPSFFGWYLPVEDHVRPYLSDRAVEAVNTLTDKARNVTPGKQILISPYGLCYADMNSKIFADQIKKLKVDIIAYQDEVGCVPEPMPMKRMKEHFTILGKIHQETNIRFWANVESFTWERETNSRSSALIPAAFPRYLSQMTGVTLAGVEEVVSFTTYSMFDQPGSEIPIGQPCYSAKAYQDYMDWLSGKGRWTLLEATFKGGIMHDGVNKKIKSYVANQNVHLLTDKQLGQETTADQSWVDFGNKRMEVVIDLGKDTKIKSLAARFLHYRKESIALPSFVHFYISKNDKKYIKVKTIEMEATVNDLHDCWIDIAWTDDMDVTARYIKVEADSRNHSKIYCDEILVNPDYKIEK